ncbi:MAG: hypothetical protein ACYC4P_07950 [Thermoanaerobaculia bacterium]
MSVSPSVLAVLRHALADPLSAATVKVEVLATRLDREAPSLSPRAREVGADLTAAGQLLDLLAAVAAIAEEAPEETPLASLVAGLDGGVAAGDTALRLCLRPSAAGLALRRLFAFGAARGAAPRVGIHAFPAGVELLIAPLGPAPAAPEKLLLLPRDVADADELFLARVSAEADGGSLRLAERGGALEARFFWPREEGR